MKILVTGGAGYIGSHTCMELIKVGFEVVIVDNLCNSSKESIKRIEELCNCKISFYQFDVRDQKAIRSIFNEHFFDAVIHFAGLKAVASSVSMPIEYYNVNFVGTLTITKIMQEFNCRNLVFSSSATVYGKPNKLPIKENFTLSASNPYGRSKLMVEDFLRDVYFSDKSWNITLLRYFNPVGAHKSGMIGEDPNDIPNNLMPFISQVAIGKLKKLKVFGGDYDTIDGTGVRDYIHVVDLAKGHVKALQYIKNKPELKTVNLGTGKGYSVLEVIKAFEKASSTKVPYEVVARRDGDVDSLYADNEYALKILDWSPKYNLNQMCEDVWRWQTSNPNGY
jgi:UDP-glucose 4-epimerase